MGIIIMKNSYKRKLQIPNKRKRSFGAMTVEYALALVIAAAIAYPMIPLMENVSARVLQSTSDVVVPHYP